MFALKSITETLELLTSSTAGIDYSITYMDLSAAGVTKSTSEGKITTATTTTILAAPGADVVRTIEKVSIRNISGSVSNSVTVKKDISGTDYFLTSTTPLAFGEVLEYENGFGWRRLDADGLSMGTGTTGAAGSVIHHGSGAPSGGTGIDGDYYIDTATGDLYSKAAGSWTFLFTLTGGGGGGSSWTIQTIVDADFTAADDICYDCQSGDITADRVITVSSITTRFRVINGQEAYTLRFSGATVYNMGGTEAVTYVLQLACVTIELINGKLIITG